jgi:mevalonate kinase
MPAFTAAAPGKIILVGEHAVVYGQPALAVPIFTVQARAVVQAEPTAASDRVQIRAPRIGLDHALAELDPDHPLAQIINLVREELKISRLPALTLHIHSEIPIAAGLGSSAAVSAAVIRALAAFLGHPLTDGQVSELTYQAEKIYHGTPSGIDNTVIAFSRPVYYRKGRPPEPFQIPQPFTLVIGDTGSPSLTSETVGAVRRGWEKQPERYQALFDAIGDLARRVRQDLEAGELKEVGPLLTENHRLLKSLGVSTPALDQLVEAAVEAGALGAKLSGGGGGGNMIALVEKEHAETLAGTLLEAGAAGTLISEVSSKS